MVRESELTFSFFSFSFSPFRLSACLYGTVFPQVIVLKQTNKQSAPSLFFSPPLTVEYILLYILLCVKVPDVIPDFDHRGRRKKDSSRIIRIKKNVHDNVMESSWSHVNNSHVGRTSGKEDPGRPGYSSRTRSKRHMDQLGA